MISEKKRHICSAGRETTREQRAEIDGSICIDFLVGIHLYLEKNIHEREKQREKNKKQKIKHRCTKREEEGEEG